jgi:uncharacterized pyridoxal phosphate-containing UPF0001 family protein
MGHTALTPRLGRSLGLSMGMSHDFEQAIEFGATYIRPVGFARLSSA